VIARPGSPFLALKKSAYEVLDSEEMVGPVEFLSHL